MSESIGKSIGQYQLLEVIGESTNRIVYKALQTSTNRHVAVKVLKPSAARSPEELQRFQAEGVMLAQFHHPRLLEVYESGESEGLVYRVERLAENRSLQDHLVVGPTSPYYDTSRAVVLLQELVEGLEFIHSQGYIHGNLNPRTILLDAAMQPLLSDFGLPARTGAGASAFMAPEQVQGGVVDRRADMYALGVLLNTILIGEPPQAGVTVSPRSRRPDLPAALDAVIFKAMAQNPDQRFQSATEFLSALRSAFVAPAPQAYVPPPVPPGGVSQTVVVSEEKKSTNIFGIIITILLILILGAASVFLYRSYVQNQGTTPTEPAAPPVETAPPVVDATQAPPVVIVATREPRPTQSGDNLPVTGTPCASPALVMAPMILVGAYQLSKKRRH
jgi:serine/threonine protein kinase